MMSTTEVFCGRCMMVTPCSANRDHCWTYWVCLVCGSVTDEEYEEYPHEDNYE